MTETAEPRRILWNDANVIWAFLIALLVTGAVFALLASMRADNFDPESLRIFYRLFLFQDYPATFVYILALIAGLVPAVQGAAVSLVRFLGARPILVSVLSGLVLALGTLFVYWRHPLSMDEYAPYLQSRIFASGALVGQFPPEIVDWLVNPPFNGRFLHASRESGQVASAYWPGFALLLTPFTALNVPWLCNPFLGALGVWIVHRLALDLTQSRDAAGAAALVAIGSAAYTINSISFYSMTAHLVCNAGFVLLLLKPSTIRCLAAGSLGGLALTLHNPMPHLFFAVPWLLWMAKRGNARHLGAMAAGYLPWVVVVGFGWHHLLHGLAAGGLVAGSAGGGNPVLEAIRIFSGVFRIPGPAELTDRSIELAKLWLWAAPGAVLLAVAGFRIHRHDHRFRLLLASALLTFLGYFFIPLDQGHGWGFRYFHSTWFVVPVFAGVALAGVARAGDCGLAAAPVIRYGLGLALTGVLCMTPLFSWQVHEFIGAHLRQLPVSDRGRERVVIISPAMGYYAQDLVQNEPFLRAPVIRMISRGKARDAAMMAASFPDLVLLSHSYRGTVWGYADASADDAGSR